MESDESAFINNMLAPPMAADKRIKRYLASSSHGRILFEQDLLAPSSMQASDAQLMGDPLEARSLVASIGMTPAGFEMPEGEIISHGYHALGDIPVDIAPALQPQIESNNKPAPFKGSWTMEEDSILRDMVMHHGEGRWSLIAQSLPGRIGKQCRERWINHVDPNIKKNDIWTVEDDMVLIQAHKSFGSHWSTIAKFLPGWPENAIKNHWNSTKRSLGSKRRLKKKKSQQAPPGQLSVLEEYIRSLEPDSKSAAPPPATSRPAVHTSVPEMELHLNAPTRHQPRAISLGNSMLPDLNLSYDPEEMHYMGYPMYDPASAPQLQLVSQEPRQATFTWLPFGGPRTALNTEHTSGPSYDVGGSSSNVGATGYYNEAGPSNVGGSGDDQAGDTNNDVLELASREFFMPSSDEVRLGLARFK